MRPDAASRASCLYLGSVVHRRATPVRHEFRYRLALLCFDVAEENRLEHLAPFFGRERRAPVSWWRSDHFGDPQVPLDATVRDLVAERTGNRPGGAVRLLTSPRVLGYGFNPISLFFCEDADGVVEAMVAEVTSTPWGERHCYVLEVPAAQRGRPVQRFVTPKQLHVSPFLGMKLDYRWRISIEDDRLCVGISARAGLERPFNVAMSLTVAPLNRASLARFMMYPPLGAAGTMAGIHFEALRLWWKGAPIHQHPRYAGAHPSNADVHPTDAFAHPQSAAGHPGRAATEQTAARSAAAGEDHDDRACAA